MLKSMRQNVKSLSPMLWLVIAAFLITIFAVYGGGSRLGEKSASNIVASVGRTKISAETYQQNLTQRLQTMAEQFQSLDRNFIQQLGIPQQTLEQLIQQELMLQAAKDMGISASPHEIREKIMSFSVFHQDGKFIGFDKYKQILEWNRSNVTEFEKALQKEVTIEKVIKLITAGIAVTEKEIWEKYKLDNESTRLEYIVLENDTIEMKDELPLQELQKYFEENKENYKTPQRREGEYIFFKTEDLKSEVKLEEADIEKYYNNNKSQFKEPEKIKVTRIYLPFREKDEEDVKTQAENILERIKQNESISGLAIEYSQDEKAFEGGDWGYYDWRRLSQQEQEEIEKLSQGETSDVLELEDGVSIVTSTEKNPAFLKPLDEVRGTITSILEEEKARLMAEEKIKVLEKKARKEKNLDIAAQTMGLKVRNSGLLASGDVLEEIDPSGSFCQAFFSMNEKEITPIIYTYKGAGIAQLTKIDPPRLANFEEVEEKVKETLLNIKKKEKTLAKMNQIKNRLKRVSIERVAKEFEVEIKTAEEHKKGQYLSILGENKEIDELAFSLSIGEVSEPIEFESGYTIIKVMDRKEVTKEDFEKIKKEEKDKLLESKRNSYLGSYIMKLRSEKGVRTRYNVFLKVNADVLARFGDVEGTR